jgi:hypothetical protein
MFKACMVLFLAILSLGAQKTQGSACNIYALYSCIAYAKSMQVPSRACCNALASLGGGVMGSKCLCSLMTSQIANQYGVIPQYAIGMPYRCGMPVPWHEVCNGEWISSVAFFFYLFRLKLSCWASTWLNHFLTMSSSPVTSCRFTSTFRGEFC